MGSVSFRHVRKKYPSERRYSVDDFHLDVSDGEFLVLVGPSGCGKSTLLRMLAGLEDITEGEMYIGGRMINYVPPKDRNIAMVFQNYALYPHMSVYENIAFGLRLRKVAKHELHERVSRAAKVLEIENHLPKLPGRLSGGQRQRVALGRAIVREPDVFLMDEPLSNLDAKLRVQMREEITRLHRKLQSTFLYVTHDQIEAMTMGTRIVIMRDGVIQQVGTPRDIYASPRNMFVGGFIGTPPMNFVHGRIRSEGDTLYFETKRYALALPADKRKRLLEGGYGRRAVVMGVRAEKAECRPGRGSGAGPAGGGDGREFPCRIDRIEFMGSDAYAHVSNEEHRLVVRVDPLGFAGIEGDPATVRIPTEDVHLFDPETEELLC
ncbi:ABC transporter ATP-binding protein [Paenibacillus flagellatus]|uniref:Sugar ABC transporter ATP-binding protein n=1 Tax=Paenibacillus flagellatus TaxID=2211139 RepID=A0A2V5KVN5_9BACL|nr:sn-glycerol-3-phosphate ABC transporter ATP-binding protein UgpC [Paenibacillus flagellatus]PYI56177.1 sugar ABC transporter ATP-binding protein [Paenibacillus flagellatus]